MKATWNGATLKIELDETETQELLAAFRAEVEASWRAAATEQERPVHAGPDDQVQDQRLTEETHDRTSAGPPGQRPARASRSAKYSHRV